MNSIGAIVTLLSLNLTISLIQDYSAVAGAFTLTNVTQTTPITITVPAHGVPPGRNVHGIISGVTGSTEANGAWVATPLDANTFALTTLTEQGILVQSVGVNPYTGGGILQYAFPDWSILLGRRNVALSSAVASPRVVFVPTTGKAWNIEPYAGAAPSIVAPGRPPARGTAEQQSMTTQPQIATEYLTFEVYVTGCGPDYGQPESPDCYDFDATQRTVFALYAVMFDAFGMERCQVLRERWPSQEVEAGTVTQRGQQWAGIVQLQVPVAPVPLQFVPEGTSLVFTVEPVNPLVPDDQTTFTVRPA